MTASRAIRIPRMIPVLLLSERGLYKTIKFRKPVYIGDPLNIVRLFNDREVDELCILDISATRGKKSPQFDYLAKLAGECFMPLSYGGGINSLDECKKLFNIGFEKIVLNTSLFFNFGLVEAVAAHFGSQSIIASIDVKKNFWGKYSVYTACGTKNVQTSPAIAAKNAEQRGAGEILLNSIDRDGTQAGYDEHLIQTVAKEVDIPVIACGGAKNLENMIHVTRYACASAVAAGALFVFYGPHKAVLINPPPYKQFRDAFVASY